MSLDVNAIRAQFPALNRPVDGTADLLPVHFDNPAGTQVPQRVIGAVVDYYHNMNANHGGVFATSQRNDAMIANARATMARFLGGRPEEIVFGPNMTTLNFGLSRAIAKTLSPGDEVVITRMDHDANVSPWLRIAEDVGLTVRHVDFDVEDFTLDLYSLENVLSEKTRVVATVHASNALGTINPVGQIAALAHNAGALHVVDAVQSTPHIPIDVQAIGCDFLLCSAYKFFGPHIGILWGRAELLDSLPAYKVRPASDTPPDKWETGTQSFETIHATAAAVEYIESVGGMGAIMAYERELVTTLIAQLGTIPGLRIYGITDPARFDERVPTVALTIEGHSPLAVAEHLAGQHVYVWNGNYYALEVMQRLGLQESGGAVRVGLAHYNTRDEIDRLIAALGSL